MEEKPPRKRYCPLKGCVNYPGTTDRNVLFFRLPRKGHSRRDEFIASLTAYTKISYVDNIVSICELHFKPDDICRTKYHPVLIQGALPIPVGIPEIVPNSCGSITKDVKLIDIQAIKKDNTISEPAVSRCNGESLIPTQAQQSTECVSCIQKDVRQKESDQKISMLKSQIRILLAENRMLKNHLNANSTNDGVTDSKEIQDLIDEMTAESIDLVELTEFIEPSDPNTNPNTALYLSNNENHPSVNLIDESSIEMEDLSDQPDQSMMICKNEPIEQTECAEPPKINKYFKCGYCDEAFEFPNELRRHIQSHVQKIEKQSKSIKLPPPQSVDLPNIPHPPKPPTRSFECYLCKKGMETKIELRWHMGKHERDQRCVICRTELTDNEMKSHLCNEKETIDCEYCQQPFLSTVAILKHLEDNHEQKRFYCCDTCHKFFPMKTLKETHATQHVKVATPFKCTICPKRFATTAALDRHKRLHTAGRNHLCEECGKGFTTKRNLGIHKMSIAHSSEAPLSCPDCPKKFFRNSDLKRHSDLHRDFKYVCDICNAELISMLGYKDHMKRHTRTEEDRRYACHLCPLKFFDSQSLKFHYRVHSSIKAFKCQFCEQSYKYKGDLNKHLKIHLGDKIHECSECLMRFQYPMELQKHIFEHYKEEKQKRVEEQTIC